MTEELFVFLKHCPYLDNFSMNIGYLSKENLSASLSCGCEDVLLRKYTDGDSIRKSTYDLRLRLPFGIDIGINGKGSLLTEQVARWLKDSCSSGRLPELSGKQTAISIFGDLPKSPQAVTADSCIYVLPVSVIYYDVR